MPTVKPSSIPVSFWRSNNHLSSVGIPLLRNRYPTILQSAHASVWKQHHIRPLLSSGISSIRPVAYPMNFARIHRLLSSPLLSLPRRAYTQKRDTRSHMQNENRVTRGSSNTTKYVLLGGTACCLFVAGGYSLYNNGKFKGRLSFGRGSVSIEQEPSTKVNQELENANIQGDVVVSNTQQEGRIKQRVSNVKSGGDVTITNLDSTNDTTSAKHQLKKK